MSNCTQQSGDGEVVVVRGQSIHERMESNAKRQIAKGNEMVSFKIGDQVFYSLSHGSNRKDSKQYGPSVISQICGSDMYLLAGLKRKYHSNQLQKVNMITSQVNKVCAFLCWYTSSNLFFFFFMPTGNGGCNFRQKENEGPRYYQCRNVGHISHHCPERRALFWREEAEKRSKKARQNL